MRSLMTDLKRFAALALAAAILCWLTPGGSSLAPVLGQDVDSPGRGDVRRGDPCDRLPDPPGQAKGIEKRCPPGGGSGGVRRGDFNGDGFADLAIGVPGEDVDGVVDAGAVNVIYGSAAGLSAAAGPGNQFWHQDGPDVIGTDEDSDRFGSALASGDFNGDGFSDLVVGAPGDDVAGKEGAGVVYALYGSPGGLTGLGSQAFHQDVDSMLDESEEGDNFGQVLNWGDFNGDGYGDLAVGVGNENVGGIGAAGAVHVLYGSPTGLTAAVNQFWHQDSPGIIDAAEGLDFFGRALAAGDFNNDGVDDLAIGVPQEGVGVFGAGAVNVLYGSFGAGLTDAFNQFWHQDTGGIFGAAERSESFGGALAAGDFNGDGRDDLAVGVPFENVAGANDAGAVNVLYGSSNRLTTNGNQLWTQNSPDVLDVAEVGDQFGGALAAGDFNGDGRDDLAIGVPTESVGDLTFAGAVQVIYGTSGGLRASVTVSGQTLLTNQFWTENNANFNGAAEGFDNFGSSLSAWNFGKGTPADLAIGIPREDVGSLQNAGAVLVLYGRPVASGSVSVEGLSTTGRQVWTQDSPGIVDQAEEFDSFGLSLY